MEKWKKALIVGIVFCLAFGVPNVYAACNFEILSWGFEPSSIASGREVTVTADVRLTEGVNERCSFLVESAVLYHTTPFRIIVPVDVSKTACCAGNENFYDLNMQMDYCRELTGCESRETIILRPKAPATGFCDHCAWRTGNPSCSAEPSYYWKGEGWYDIGIGGYNQCYRSGEPFERYDFEISTIYVSAPVIPPPDGDGQCTDFWTCQIFWILTGTDLVVASVIVIVLIAMIAYIYRKKK